MFYNVLMGIIVVVAIGSIVACVAAKKAPNGFEDKDGFHLLKK